MINVSVKRSLACPLVRDDVARSPCFLASTCCRNEEALSCSRCRNVDRAVRSSGPRGAGQSLVSYLIDTAFGDLHRWVDVMMRCASKLPSSLPQTDCSMRGDVFKRHTNGDPIACRLTYARAVEGGLFHWLEKARDGSRSTDSVVPQGSPSGLCSDGHRRGPARGVPTPRCIRERLT